MAITNPKLFMSMQHHCDRSRNDEAIAKINAQRKVDTVCDSGGRNRSAVIRKAFRLLAAKLQTRHPILLKDVLIEAVVSRPRRRKESEASSISTRPTAFSLNASHRFHQHRLAAMRRNRRRDFGARRGSAGTSAPLSYNILQAAGSRIFKTDYVACPSCGRTLFNLQTTTAKIKAATLHLKGVKIAIMGCIVNGPGEMADADFGTSAARQAK
jgi:(E)-4-hydroxy-3-methylbut-2-enyl-diphosphate synthase